MRRAIKWFRDNRDLAKVTGSIVQSAILKLIPFLLSLYGAEILQMDWVFANNLEFAFSAQGHSVRSDIKDKSWSSLENWQMSLDCPLGLIISALFRVVYFFFSVGGSSCQSTVREDAFKGDSRRRQTILK